MSCSIWYESKITPSNIFSNDLGDSADAIRGNR